ncbi:hypothetical protein FRC12_005700 [Ceratobasidium sp. 428]|nr:hypothetical protein FRC12_005700 [Ceratobasidium sp. 428]
MDDLLVSQYCLWLGDPNRIFRNCKWVADSSTNSATLQWKLGAPNKPTGSEGPAIIGFIGMAAADGSMVKPDTCWKVSYGDFNSLKHMRVVYVGSPGFTSRILVGWWDQRIKGSDLIIDNARKMANGVIGRLGNNVFLNLSTFALRLRSPIFLPQSTSEEGTESYLPKTYCYPTWEFSSKSNRAVFDRVIAKGHEPQPLEAYGRHSMLIHPNQVHHALPGAIVLAYCTLERILSGLSAQPEWQFNANLVKLQVLKQPVSVGSSKRKYYTYRYGSNNASTSGGSSSKVRKNV